MPRLTLGQRIKRARQAAGLTQEGLGAPDLTKGFISLLEHDRAKPSVRTLERLAMRLGQPVSYFLDGGDAVSEKLLAVLASRGRGELSRRQYEPARQVFAELDELAGACRNEAMRMRAEAGLGEAFLGLRRLDEAHRHLDAALAAGRALGDAEVECRALHGLATVAHRRGQFPQAMTLYKDALVVLPRLGGTEPQLAGEIHLYLGTVLGRMGHSDAAVEAYTKAQELFEGARRPERVGEALMGLGNVLSTSGDLEGALGLYERARALFEQYEDIQATAYVRNSLGIVLLQTGRPRDALAHFEASLAIKQRLMDGVGECRTLTELARCHFICGERELAEAFAQRASARSGEVHLPDEDARARIVLGLLAAERGDVKVAVERLHEAAAQCQRSSMMPELVTIYHELARLASRKGQHKDAAGFHEQAFEALRAVKPNDIVAALHLADLAGLRAEAALNQDKAR
jgi:tetratricopeptide (TPR) repeat protein